jgi:AmmeMemoRadiSam system protein A
MRFSLTEREKRILIGTAREAIESRLLRTEPRYPEPTAPLLAPCGAFVTLKKEDSLRGCIGHIAATKSLVDTIKEVAVASAFEDPRFPPLRREEWPATRIEISVLSPLERITDTAEIEVGVHGIVVRQGYRSGLLLPQVATEQGWDRDTFLAHTCRKAGLPSDAWRQPGTQIEIFSALVFHEQDRE